MALLPDPVALEEDGGACEAQNWRDTVSPQLLATLSSKEVDRQAVIYGTTQRDPKKPQTFQHTMVPRWFPDDVPALFSSVLRAVHHRGVPPAHAQGPGPGLLPEDETGAERFRVGLHFPKPAPSLRTARSDRSCTDALLYTSV